MEEGVVGSQDKSEQIDQCDAASDAGSADDGESFATFVAEAGHLKDLVAAIHTDDTTCGRICSILDRYQEQPQLLDPHLELIVAPLAATLREAAERSSGSSEGASRQTGEKHLRTACRVLYVLAKVRGFKVVIKFFPHSVADLEPCLDLLDHQDMKDPESWETRYVLLLWLSILVMVPFGLDSVDSATSGTNLIERIIEACKNCLGEAAKTRDAAAYLLARLLTRPDMDDNAPGAAGGRAVSAGSAPLVAFLQWCVQQMEGAGGQLLVTGVYQALAHIFKMGQRNSLLDKVALVSDVLHTQAAAAASSSTQRHNTCKLAQRLGLTYLPPRVAAWRYTRGHRSLLDNLKAAAGAGPGAAHAAGTATCAPTAPPTSGPAAAAGGSGAGAGEADDDDDAFVPIEVEYVIDTLLHGLQDRDTVVRWSGAKGLGRVAARLPRHLANEVVEAVMGLFTSEDASQVNTWHGGCLALAELARRGILLPERLAQAAALVQKALVFDVRRGSTSIGAHVRDAAAYVCWAFARAYAPAELAPHVPVLAKSLLVAALYDREINCRRAAAAAFQENVGRQGNYPHGIDIVTRADYFALGNRANAYLVIAPFVAQYPEYQEALARHLLTRQLQHWDLAIRVQAAAALRKLVPLFPDFFIATALPLLLDAAMASDVPTRHGAACALAQILLGLRRNDAETSDGGSGGHGGDDAARPDSTCTTAAHTPTQTPAPTQTQTQTPTPTQTEGLRRSLPKELEARLVGLVPAVEKARLFRGRGGEAMRGACCRVIEAIALVRLPLTPTNIQRFVDSLGENLKHPTEDIAAAAVAGVHAMSRTYFPGGMPSQWQVCRV